MRKLAPLAGFVLTLSLVGCASTDRKETAVDHQEGYFVDHASAVARCGVGNYVQPGVPCARTAEVAPAETPVTLSQAAPEPTAAERFRARVEEMSGRILFETDSASLSAVARRDLAALAEEGRELGSDLPALEIRGHADAQGSEDYNLALSRQRAQAVRAALAGDGVAARALDIKAWGESAPVATNDTDSGRQRNRRVEFSVSDSETLRGR